MRFKYTKVTCMIMSLLLVPVMASATDSFDDFNPECTKRMLEIKSILEAAHANKEFLMVTLNKDSPYNANSDTCNMNLIVTLKDEKDSEEVRTRLLAYVKSKSELIFSNPTVSN